MYKEIGEFINTSGFPMFVGIFVLWRLEPTLSKILETLTAIKTMLEEK